MFKKHEFLRFKGQSDFQMPRNTTKSYGAQYLKFSILKIFEKCWSSLI